MFIYINTGSQDKKIYNRGSVMHKTNEGTLPPGSSPQYSIWFRTWGSGFLLHSFNPVLLHKQKLFWFQQLCWNGSLFLALYNKRCCWLSMLKVMQPAPPVMRSYKRQERWALQIWKYNFNKTLMVCLSTASIYFNYTALRWHEVVMFTEIRLRFMRCAASNIPLHFDFSR